MKTNTFFVPVTFDGGLQSSVRADLINELLKYILFERQQIPFSFEQIKREVKLKTAENNVRNDALRKRLEIKKAVDLVDKLDETRNKICMAFDVCPEIQQVAFTLGATAVSPKEVFVIHLPPLNPDADNLPSKSCVKTMFRQLITQDPLRDVKQISPTNISLLIYAPRNSELSWFYPKPLYKLPVRGKQFEFSLQSNCGQGRHDLTANFSIVELSGFEPFDSFFDDEDDSSEGSEGSLSADYVCVDSDHDIVIVENSDAADTSSTSSLQSSTTEASDSTLSVQESTSSVHSPASIVSNSQKKGKKMKKSSSSSSVLSQVSLFSRESSSSARKSRGQDQKNSQDTNDTGVFSLTDTDFIWFQSPVVIKGYKSKS